MDTDIDDMFAILSFLRICKMYKKLKRKRSTKRYESVNKPTSVREKTKSQRFEENSDHSQSPHLQEARPFCSVVQQEELQDECLKTVNDEHVQEDIEISVCEEKPHIIQETGVEEFIGEDCQYEISFEVNGQHQQVLLGKLEAQPESKYECLEGAEICFEVDPETQEIVFQNAEEMHTSQCDENIISEISLEEPPAEIINQSDLTLSLAPAPKKRRRRRRRGEILEPEEIQPIKKKPRTRNFKIRPENMDRHQEGFFGKVFLKIKREDEKQFILLTRMRRSIFEKLLKLTFKPMSKRVQLIYPEERLSITLLYLAHGTPFDVIAKKYKLGKTTVRNIVLETCEILYEVLAPICMPEPNSENYLKIAKDFQSLCKLPNCVGIIDGKHVAIKMPKRTVLEEYNLSSLSSLIIVAACDAKYLFRSATVTVKAHQSALAKGIMNNTLTLPPNSPLEADSIDDFPYYFIGDATFPLRSNLLVPYVGSNLNDKEIYYNYRLSLGQAVMETTFSILSATWRVMLTTFDLSPLNCEAIVMACIVLHNFLIKNGEERWRNSDGTISTELPHDVNEHTEWVNVESVQYKTSLESIAKFGSESSGIGHEIRDAFVDYFYNDASNETQTTQGSEDIFEI